MRNQLLDAYDTATSDLLRSLDAALDSDVRRPLVDRYSTLAEEVDRLLDGWTTDVPERPAEAAERARTAHSGLTSSVLVPLGTHLADQEPFMAIQTLTARTLHRLEQAASALPASVVIDEPPSLHAPLNDDPLVWRTRKALIRLRRRLFDGKRNEPYEQHLRPQGHALTLATQAAPDRIVPLVHDVLETVLWTTAHTERELTEAFYALMSLERTARLAAGSEEQGPLTDAWKVCRERLSAAAAALRNAARELAEHGTPGAWTAAEVALEEAFRTRLDRDDTFMAVDIPERRSPAEHRAWRTLQDRSERSRTWLDQVVQRYRFCSRLDGFTDQAVAARQRILDRLAAEAVHPFQRLHEDAAATLAKLAEEVDDALAAHDVAAALGSIRERAVDAIDRSLLTGFIRDTFVNAMSSIPADEASRLLPDLEEPTVFHLHGLVPEDARAVDIQTEPRAVDLADVVEALGQPLLDALRGCMQPLVARLDDVRAEDREITSIIRFNIDSALELLADAAGERSGSADIRELALKGLTRSSDSLLAQADRMQDALDATAAHITRAFAQAGTRVQERARVQRQVDEYLLDLRDRFDTGTRGVVATAGRRARWTRLMTLRYGRRARRHAQRLIRLGREAVGAPVTTGLERQETIEALLRLDEALERVPVVYRRLFSFAPVQDADMLVGRVADRDAVATHRQRWARGFTQSLMITAQPGQGVTSFLNVLRKTVFEGDRLMAINLTERVSSEAALVDMLCRELGLEEATSRTLRELAQHVLAATAEPSDAATAEPIPVVLIEHLELLLLREIGGMRLFSEFLSFMSQTDSRVLWIGTCSASAWQVFGKAQPSASGLVNHHPLSTLTRASLEKLVMGRHRRSGLSLRFLPPANPSTLLKRRMRRADSEEDVQRILQDVYFERLHDHVGPNILMALFYWIRSITPSVEEDTIEVGRFEPISFRFLADLPGEHILMLKALLEHFTLTVPEAARVAWTTRDDAMQIFEALGNALLIEPFTDENQASRDAFSTVDPTLPYRIRPLLVHPVVTFLRTRNIVH
ncbi:MAG: hypothetical protein RIE53_10345 [Rhodothermales bacterium]